MAIRLGILDLAGAGLVAAILVLPTPSKQVHPLYTGEAAARAPELAAAQADLARDPRDHLALTRYADLLDYSGQSDWALRATGAAWELESPTRWRAALAVASVHADRLDAQEAHDWADKALTACDATGAVCPPHERVRIALYLAALKAGIDSGIDPKVDPQGFKDALNSATPMIRVGGKRGLTPPQN